MDGAPSWDDPIFSDFGTRGGTTGAHSIQVMLSLHGGGGHHGGSDLMPTGGGQLHKLDSSSSPSHHQTASQHQHHLQQQQQQQQQQKELKELELSGMYAPLPPQTQDVTTSTSTSVTPTSTSLQQGLQLGNALKRKPDDPINALAPGNRYLIWLFSPFPFCQSCPFWDMTPRLPFFPFLLPAFQFL